MTELKTDKKDLEKEHLKWEKKCNHWYSTHDAKMIEKMRCDALHAHTLQSSLAAKDKQLKAERREMATEIREQREAKEVFGADLKASRERVKKLTKWLRKSLQFLEYSIQFLFHYSKDKDAFGKECKKQWIECLEFTNKIRCETRTPKENAELDKRLKALTPDNPEGET